MISTYIYLPVTGSALWLMIFITTIVSLLSIIMGLILVYIYIKSYKEYKTSFTSGLIYFAIFFTIVAILNTFSLTRQLFALYPLELISLLIVYAQFLGTAILLKITYQT